MNAKVAPKRRVPKQPWKPADATQQIQRKVNDPCFDVGLKLHAKEQMDARGIDMGDVLHTLKRGTVYDEAVPATQDGYFRYKVICRTPNSGAREIAVVVIPFSNASATIVTVMWADEKASQGG